MKKVLIKSGVLMAFLTVVLIACQKDLFNKDDGSLSVEEAKSWFEANQPEYLVLKSGRENGKTKVIKPHWQGAYGSKNREVEVVETHIMSNGAFGFATKDAYNEWLATDNSGYITSMSRIVVMRYKDTGGIVSFIMTIVGDKDYLEQKNFELWDNDYTKKDNNFSGLILYHELDGSFANGWRYTNGELTHKVTLDTDMDIDIGLKSYDCTTYNIYEITEQCTDWYVNGEYDGYSCTTSSTYIGTQTSCVWVDDGGTSSGGGGGYSPSPAAPSPEYPIESIQDYLECFNANNPALITFYVDQPIANSSEPYYGLNVGHTFIGIKQGENSTYFGFYPENKGKPGATDDSALGNDSNHNFDVSLTMPISATQLGRILSFVLNYPEIYDTDNYNCTDFAIDIGNRMGIDLPEGEGTWPGGGAGSNPGTFGQELRNSHYGWLNLDGGTAGSNIHNCSN